MAKRAPKKTHYGIILNSAWGDDLYAFTFTSKELLDWINSPVEFGDASEATISIPGIEGTVTISSGSTENDKLLVLRNCSESYGPHSDLTEVHGDYAEVSDHIWGLCEEQNIFEGNIY